MSSAQQLFPLERCSEISQRPEDFRLLERIPFTLADLQARLPLQLSERESGERTHGIVFLDSETTGLDSTQDKMIELGMVRATFAYDRRILLSIDSIYDEFQDPLQPIPERITRLTGIDNLMTAGHQFDHARVKEMLAGRPLVVAHNAAFDRPFFDREFAFCNNLSWACSMKIAWEVLGSSSGKLEFLNMQRGWFYDAHRACTDCLALAWLMHIEPDALGMVCDQALAEDCLLYITGHAYEIKDRLKSQGYRFDGKRRQWYIRLPSEAALQQHLDDLGKFYDCREVEIRRCSARERFKNR